MNLQASTRLNDEFNFRKSLKTGCNNGNNNFSLLFPIFPSNSDINILFFIILDANHKTWRLNTDNYENEKLLQKG